MTYDYYKGQEDLAFPIGSKNKPISTGICFRFGFFLVNQYPWNQIISILGNKKFSQILK